MKKAAVYIIVSLICASTYSQNIIGMHKFDLQKYMKDNNSSFVQDNSVRNSTYKYLKYEDKFNQETYLFFLSNNDYCTSYRLVSDYSNLNKRVKDLNKSNISTGENTWEYTEEGKTFVIELKKKEWYFMIETKKKE